MKSEASYIIALLEGIGKQVTMVISKFRSGPRIAAGRHRQNKRKEDRLREQAKFKK